MTDSYRDSYKLPDGGEILIGRSIHAHGYVVSSWDADLCLRWEKYFSILAEAQAEFERFRP